MEPIFIELHDPFRWTVPVIMSTRDIRDNDKYFRGEEGYMGLFFE
jgi:hypothetical protein